jgi:hypothetical protein
VVGGARNEPGSTLLTLILTPLKMVLKTCNQIGNLLLKLDVFFGSMKKLTLERATQFTRRG